MFPPLKHLWSIGVKLGLVQADFETGGETFLQSISFFTHILDMSIVNTWRLSDWKLGVCGAILGMQEKSCSWRRTLNFGLQNETGILQETNIGRGFYTFVWSKQKLRGGNSEQALTNYLQKEDKANTGIFQSQILRSKANITKKINLVSITPINEHCLLF